MNEFLKVAKSLEVNEIELSGNDNILKEKPDQTDELPLSDEIQEKVEGSIHKELKMESNQENKYPCDQCSYKATRLGNLQHHVKSIHERVQHPCDQCTYIATDPNRLQQHVKSIHEGVDYQCDECSFKYADPSNLRRHKKSIHRGIKYPCDQCNYKASFQGNLQKHKTSFHRLAKLKD